MATRATARMPGSHITADAAGGRTAPAGGLRLAADRESRKQTLGPPGPAFARHIILVELGETLESSSAN